MLQLRGAGNAVYHRAIWQSEEEEPGPPGSWVLLSHPRIWSDLGLHFIGLRGWEL